MSAIESILLPTAYFPSVPYFALLTGGKQILVELHETFPKQTIRNRCEIMTVSGKASLTVPVTRTHGNHTRTSDMSICYRQHWQRNHWRTLQAAYNSSPFFSYYSGFLEELFEQREPSLILYNHKIIMLLSKLIGIQPAITFTSDYEKNPAGMMDLRTNIYAGNNPLIFNYPEYPQVFAHFHGFIGGLSILDLLFNLGPETKDYLDKIESRI